MSMNENNLIRIIGMALATVLCFVLSGFCAVAEAAERADAPNLIQSFPVGIDPWSLTFDGANIWTTSLASSNVTKLRASDGALLGTFDAGGTAGWAAFDGGNVWFSNFDNDTVTKLREVDGVLRGTFAVG